MLCKHLHYLRRRGHWVMAAFRGPPGSPVLPPWAHIEVDCERLLLPHENIRSLVPLVDVVMIGYFTQLLDFKDDLECAGPIVYWDQGVFVACSEVAVWVIARG